MSRTSVLFGFLASAYVFLGDLSAAQSRISFMKEQGDQKTVVIANEDGEELFTIAPEKQWALYPSISADGNRVAYLRGTTSDLGVFAKDLSSGHTLQITAVKGRHFHPDFSSDGRYLAFSGPSPDGQSNRIGIVNVAEAFAATSNKSTTAEGAWPEVKWLEGEATAYAPSLSSSGEWVVFHESVDRQHRRLVMVHVQSGERTVLDSGYENSMDPAFSFDDRLIAFTSKVEDRWQISVYDRQSQDVLKVSRGDASDYAPTFAPDGSIYFASDRDQLMALYRSSRAVDGNGYEDAERWLGGSAALYSPSVSGRTNIRQGVVESMLPPARSSFGAGIIGQELLIVGGHQGPEHHYPPESFLATLEKYHVQENAWSAGAPRHTPSHGYDVAIFDQKLYAFGGFAFNPDITPNWRSLSDVDVYDPKTDRWERMANMPRPRSSNVVATVDGKAYLIGGWDSTPREEGDKQGRFHRAIDIFDFASGTFVQNQLELPDPLRRAFSAVTYQDEIILVGGISKGASHFSLLDNVSAFNPIENTWRELPPLPNATFAPAITVLNGKLYVFGGMYRTGRHAFEYVNHIYALDLASEDATWEHTGRTLSETKGFSQVVNAGDDTAYILGGHSYEGGNAPVSTVEVFSVGE